MDLESHHPAAKIVLTCHLEATGTDRLLTCHLEATGTKRLLTCPLEATGTNRLLTCPLEATGTDRLLTCPLEATGTTKPPSSLGRVTGAATREPPNTHAHATEFMSARRQVEVVGWQISPKKLRSALGDHAGGKIWHNRPVIAMFLGLNFNANPTWQPMGAFVR